MTNPSEILSRLIAMVFAGIFAQRHIQGPVELILHVPFRANLLFVSRLALAITA